MRREGKGCLWVGFLAIFCASMSALGQGADLYGADVYWNATPNDVNRLLKSMAEQVDAHYQVEIKTLSEVSTSPESNPVLYRTGHYNFEYTSAEREKLREFLLAGGMILYNTGLGSVPFYRSVVAELKKIFPEQPLQRLGSDHPIFHAFYDVDQVSYTRGVREAGFVGDEPWFDAIEINCRVVALVSRWGLAVGWQGDVEEEYRAYSPESAFRLGVNILAYASAMRAWAKNAVRAMRFVDTEANPGDRFTVSQVVYNGVWKTRHAGLSVLLQTFNQRTGIPVKFGCQELRLTDPLIFNAPLLYLTGHEFFTLDEKERSNLRRFLENGGFLFAEACCGRKAFDLAFRKAMKAVLPDYSLRRIAPDALLYSDPNGIDSVGITPGLMEDLGKAAAAPYLLGIKIDDHFAVIYSPFGMAGGWEMSQSPYALGYSGVSAIQLGQNVLLYSITH